MPFKHSKIHKRESRKKRYRVRNWPDYNQALINRGGLVFMLADDITDQWCESLENRKPGGQKCYTDYAIEICLQIRALLRLPLRQTQGFLRGLFARMDVDLPVPHYSELSVRASKLNIKIKQFSKKEKTEKTDGICVMIDSTGMKIYGESEWSDEKHNTKTRKSWRKLHIAIDDKGNILASTLTKNNVDDGSEVPDLINQIDKNVSVFMGDGAYDTTPVHEFFEGRCPEIEIVTPPRKDAVFSPDADTNPTQRDRHLKIIHEKGRTQWQYESGYGQRSLVENAMYRIKTIYGGKLKSRNIENQKTERKIVLNNINMMTGLGMPESYAVIF
jgi:DDE family transposase